MPRSFVALLLALLLIGMQGEAQRHPLEHVAGTRAHEPALESSAVGSSCALCAMLAGGCDAPIDDLAIPGDDCATGTFAPPPAYFLAAREPAFYSSRAPPSLV